MVKLIIGFKFMTFYIVLSALAITGIVAISVKRLLFAEKSHEVIKSESKNALQSLRLYLSEKLEAIKKSRTEKQVDKLSYKKKSNVSDGRQSFFDEKNQPKDELWRSKSSEELFTLAEQAICEKDFTRALNYLDFLKNKRYEQEIEEYLCSLMVATYEGLEDFRSAVDYCDRLLVLAEKDHSCIAKKAELYFKLGEHKQAEEQIERALEISADNIDHLDLLAQIYTKTYRPREAEEIKKKVVLLRMKTRG